MRLWVLMALGLLAIALAGPTALAGASTDPPIVGTLQVIVTDNAGGAIEDVPVRIIIGSTTLVERTDESGHVAIKLKPGWYRISTDRVPGFAPTRSSRVRVRPGRTSVVKVCPVVSNKDVLCELLVWPSTDERKPVSPRPAPN